MRMKKIVENRTLKSAAAEFIAFKQVQKIRERTLYDYQKYITPFLERSSNSMDIDVLTREILEYFANIPATSPARYNHPYSWPGNDPNATDCIENTTAEGVTRLPCLRPLSQF